MLIGGYARTAEGQSLVESGWCIELVADRRSGAGPGPGSRSPTARRPARRRRVCRTRCSERSGRATGPVLVQVPRRGYRESLSCQTVAIRRGARPARVRWSRRPRPHRWPAAGAARGSPWECPHCHGRRSGRRSSGRCGRPRSSAGVRRPRGHHLRRRDDPSTPCRRVGARARHAWRRAHVDGRLRLVVLLDTWLMLAREDVRVDEEAHRRWFNALALARPCGSAIAVGDPATLQALVRADPVGFAARELAGRAETHLPPTARLATIDGPDDVLAELGPRPGPRTPRCWVRSRSIPRSAEAGERLILRSPRREGAALPPALRRGGRAQRRQAARPAHPGRPAVPLTAATRRSGGSHPRLAAVRVVFAGTPETALPSLEALVASRHDVVAVITRPDAPAGRGRTLTPRRWPWRPPPTASRCSSRPSRRTPTSWPGCESSRRTASRSSPTAR